MACRSKPSLIICHAPMVGGMVTSQHLKTHIVYPDSQFQDIFNIYVEITSQLQSVFNSRLSIMYPPVMTVGSPDGCTLKAIQSRTGSKILSCQKHLDIEELGRTQLERLSEEDG